MALLARLSGGSLLGPGLGRLARRVLSLLGSPTGRVLRLACRLAGLIGGLTGHLLGLSRRLSGRVLYALRGLAYLVGDPTERASSPSAGRHPAGRRRSGRQRCPAPAGGLACSVLDLTRYLTGLVGCLACHLLSLACRLPRCVLRLLSRTLREFRYLLLRALGGLVHLILDALVLGRLVYGPFELHIVVGHLLDLGLGVALGELLGVLLELLAVVLDLALQAANGLRVEVLGALLGCCWICC